MTVAKGNPVAAQDAPTLFEMSAAELEEAKARVEGLVRQVEVLLRGLVQLTPADRRTSRGKLRKGELAALRAILEVAAEYPDYFAVLADRDGGDDPKRFEAALLLDVLARIELLTAIAQLLAVLQTQIADTLLVLGAQVRPAALAAYRIAKPLAENHVALHTTLVPALSYYGQTSLKGIRTKAARKPAK